MKYFKYFSTITKISNALYPRSYRPYQNVVQKKGYRTNGTNADDVFKTRLKSKIRDSVVINSDFGSPAKEKKGVIEPQPVKERPIDLEFERSRDRYLVPKNGKLKLVPQKAGIHEVGTRRDAIDLEFEEDRSTVPKELETKRKKATDLEVELDGNEISMSEKPRTTSNKAVAQESAKKEKKMKKCNKESKKNKENRESIENNENNENKKCNENGIESIAQTTNLETNQEDKIAALASAQQEIPNTKAGIGEINEFNQHFKGV